MPRSPIWLGDLITALRVLGVDDDTTRAYVARVLGLERAAPAESPDTARTSAGTSAAGQRPGGTVDTPLTLEVSAQAASIATDLVPLPREVEPSVAPLGPALQGEGTTGDVDVEPLFDPRWSRSLVAGIARTESAEGPIDVDALVDRVAKAQPVQRLPRESAPTLRRGAQVLVDVGEAMLPFSRDQVRLVKRLRDLVGNDQVEEVRFEGCPRLRQAGADPAAADWYDPPRPGTPVLALTDLGVGRTPPGGPRATTADWIAIATAIQRAGSHIVALVPYPAARVAAEIRRVVTVVTWDRGTRPSAVRTVVRGAGTATR